MIYIFALILTVILIVLSIIDFRHFRLPDVLTLLLIAIGFGQSFLFGLTWQASLIGAIVGYGVFLLIEVSFKRLRGKEGLGRGDAKLLAAGGAWCGWQGLPFIVLIASGSGLIALLFPSMRKTANEKHIPFGPFLAFAILLVWASFNFRTF